MLMGVASARIDLRVASGRVERLLERYTEPLSALHGGAWPERLLELSLAAGRRQLCPRFDLRVLA